MASYLVPHLSAVASIALLGWTVINIPGRDTLRRMAMFPLILASIAVTIVTAKDAGPLQLWNIYLGMMFGTQLALAVFHILFVVREEYHDGSAAVSGSMAKDASDREHIDLSTETTLDASQRPSPSSWTVIYSKIRFSVDLVVNKRRINHADQVAQVPAFNRHRGTSYIPSRHQFLLYRTARFVLCYLVLDILTLQDLEDAESKCAPGQERILARLVHRTIPPHEFAEVVGMVVAYGACGAIGLTGCYDFVSLLAVGPGSVLLGDDVRATRPSDWPPLFGDLRQAYSLRRFWAVFWHQQFRVVLTSLSGVVVYDVLRLPRVSSPSSSAPSSLSPSAAQSRPLAVTASTPRLLLTRYVRLFIALLLSGALHLNSDRVQGVHPRDSGAVWFFVWQFVGFVVEDCARALYAYVAQQRSGHSGEKSRGGCDVWARVVGFVWVGAFMVLVAPTWMFPVLRAGQATVVPVSVVGRVVWVS